jgi:hypothetical protein
MVDDSVGTSSDFLPVPSSKIIDTTKFPGVFGTVSQIT